MILVVGGAIALVLIVGVSVLLFKFRGEYARVQSDLQTSLVSLERLHQRTPFPTAENVERVRSNLKELESYLDTTLNILSAGQVETEYMERAAFPVEIERTSRRLRAMAAERDISLAEGVAFGFERYAAGNLPMQEHVPRLVVQLRTVERLCTLLFESEISELVHVQRKVFDVERTQQDLMDQAGSRRGRTEAVVAAPATPVQPEGVEGLYTKERYTLDFFATDQALRDVLNGFVRSPMLMVVRNIELRNEMGLGGTSPAARLASRLQRPDPARPGAPGQEQEAARPLQHDDRVVAGRERVRVTLTVDVYRFEHGVSEDDS